ncbi:unnamed protein product [Parnassius apollo]|uniref:(apollo) hypothetical protein n=1 Tax=Parnassius apollo TaxID=110799 RepID=A0A8S3Y5T0_PARAO|nr:unnamed protein product [Parnassius apollo]
MEFQVKEVILAPNRRGRKKLLRREKLKNQNDMWLKDLQKIPQCVHRNLKQGYKYNELTTQDYTQTPKKEGKKTQTICYFIPKYASTVGGKCSIKLKKVCQKAMTTLLGISKDIIQRICKRHLTTMELPKERRGGDRRSSQYSGRTESVK